MADSLFFEKIVPNVKGVPIKISKHKENHLVPAGYICSNPHIHSELELLHILSGELVIRLEDGSEHVSRTGDVVCINSNVPHSTYVPKECILKSDMLHFNTDEFITPTYVNLISKLGSKSFEITRDEELTHFFNEAIRHASTPEPSGALYLKSVVYGILAVLYRNSFLIDESEGIDDNKLKRIMPALDYIASHYNENISLDEVSNINNMSNFYFCRLFKSLLNMGFTDYLNTVRVHHSTKLLAESNLSITEIALENGFSSVSYFNRVFKSIQNCSPSEYRRFSKEGRT